MSITRNLAIMQRITAGSQFSGVVPTTTPTESDNIRWFPTDTVGGLFVFDGEDHPIDIRQLEIDFGGQTSWTLSMTDGAEDFVIAVGTTEAAHFERDVATLPAGWKLKLVTVGATTAMKALVWYQRSSIL